MSSGIVAQTNKKIGNPGLRKIGNFVLKKWEKNRKINSTFVDKDSLPTPHQGYCCQATRLRSRLIQIAFVTSLGCLYPQHLWSSSRNCLKNSEKRIASIHGNFFTFTCIHTLRLQKGGFLYKMAFLPGFTFFTSHFIFLF